MVTQELVDAVMKDRARQAAEAYRIRKAKEQVAAGSRDLFPKRIIRLALPSFMTRACHPAS